MSSGETIKLVTGVGISQISASNFTSQFISQEADADFYVGPNGKALPKEFKKWMGKNQRESLLKKAKNPTLKNAINQMYRPGSFIGDGGTASVIEFEKATGLRLGKNGNTHVQKGREMIRYIEKKVLSQKSISFGDRKMAEQLVKDLKKAIGGK